MLDVLALLTLLAVQDAPRFSHEDSVQALVFAPDGKTLASAGVDRSIRLWNLATGELIRTVGEHEGRVQSLAFSPDGQTLYSCSTDTKVQVWNPARGEKIRTLQGHQDAVLALAVSPDGQFLASASLDQTVRIWDTRTGKLVRVIEYPDDSAPALSFSEDGKEIYVGFNPSPKVRCYSITSGNITRAWNVHKNGDLTSLVTAGRFCVAGTASGILYRFDTQNLLPPERIHHRTAEGCLALAASPDGKLLLLGTSAEELELIELASLQTVREFDFSTTGMHALHQPPRPALKQRIRSVAFSPTTAFLAAGNQNGHLRVWRLTDLMPKKVLTAPRLTSEKVTGAWENLQAEGEIAYQALAELATYPEQSLPFLAERLKPAPAVDEKQIRTWIEQLNDDDFNVRETAHRKLQEVAKSIEGILREVQRGGKLPTESARRVGELLEPLTIPVLGAERLREQRLVLLLQVMGSPEARALLETLSKGGIGSPLTGDARAALKRINER